jgi:hypothetical protein
MDDPCMVKHIEAVDTCPLLLLTAGVKWRLSHKSPQQGALSSVFKALLPASDIQS